MMLIGMIAISMIGQSYAEFENLLDYHENIISYHEDKITSYEKFTSQWENCNDECIIHEYAKSIENTGE